MKRRVGAVLVRERRIVSTGCVLLHGVALRFPLINLGIYSYNGTPRWLKNCNEGGCGPCNGRDTERECICLHAEENAISEAGRERVGQGAVLYCNTCVALLVSAALISTHHLLQMSVREMHDQNHPKWRERSSLQLGV